MINRENLEISKKNRDFLTTDSSRETEKVRPSVLKAANELYDDNFELMKRLENL